MLFSNLDLAIIKMNTSCAFTQMYLGYCLWPILKDFIRNGLMKYCYTCCVLNVCVPPKFVLSPNLPV